MESDRHTHGADSKARKRLKDGKDSVNPLDCNQLIDVVSICINCLVLFVEDALQSSE
jgi:hypothetical protein